MAIKSYKCKSCDKSEVCSIKTILDKFHEDAKKDLGIDLEINECRNYSSAE
jgi:aerobic-type carbon monoxide dehydrogenase small subunit (CoxS/CutS family)